MPRSRRSAIAPRKLPSQARSTQLVADILSAAVRVLERDGARGFNTIRVAEKAGVSVGSLYQYFPNKQSILFRLQLDEWKRTGAELEKILGDATVPPPQRLRALVRAFFRSEFEEAPLRRALDASAPKYEDAPEARGHREHGEKIVDAFAAAAAPHATPAQRKLAVEIVFVTMTSIGERISDRSLDREEIDRWADEIAEMLTGYLARLKPARGR